MDEEATPGPNRRVFLTADEAATLLRTTRRAVYALIERGWMAGAVCRIGRRVLIRRKELIALVERSSTKA